MLYFRIVFWYNPATHCAKTPLLLGLMKHIIIISLSVAALLCLGCSKKQASPEPQANAPEADAAGKIQCGKYAYDAKEFGDWLCLNGVMRCLNKDGCGYKGQKAPMRTFVSGEDATLYCDNSKVEVKDLAGFRCLDEHIEHIYAEGYRDPETKSARLHMYSEDEDSELVKYIAKNRYLVCNADKCGDLTRGEKIAHDWDEIRIDSSPCDPSQLLPGTTCKNAVVYCGEKAFPGKFPEEWRCVQNQWICVEPACWCAGEDKYTGKFGTCVDGNPYCGDKMQTPPGGFPPVEGYICQNGKWTCASPKGCGQCEQFQTLNDKGKCEGKSVVPKISRVECKEGNCPCGDGACPKGGACLTIPGKDPICMCGNYSENPGCVDESELPMYSNKYGEFACDMRHDGGTSARYSVWFVKCEKAEGCHIQGETANWKPLDDMDPKSFWYDPMNNAQSNEPEKFHLVKGDPYNAALKEAKLAQCGRNTSLEFKQTHANKDGAGESKDSCAMRTNCDTMPVPRADRKNFSCDFVRDPHGPYNCHSWIDYDWEPVGLRCNADSGCTCNQETCAKGQLCVDGVCRYDTLYAHHTCGNVYPHLAPDESGWSLKDENSGRYQALGGVHVYSPSDSDYAKYGDIADEIDADQCPLADAYVIHEKQLLWDNYSTDVARKLVTPNGTCMCGYSEVTPKKLSDYKCVQSLGYVCVNPKGCACGNIQCQSGALCLREGLCSPVVMDKGLAPEKISDDVKKWCEEYLQG